jgi:hypothetical protein
MGVSPYLSGNLVLNVYEKQAANHKGAFSAIIGFGGGNAKKKMGDPGNLPGFSIRFAVCTCCKNQKNILQCGVFLSIMNNV